MPTNQGINEFDPIGKIKTKAGAIMALIINEIRGGVGVGEGLMS